MFRYFPTPEHVDKDLAICGRALGLAQELRDPAILAETRTVQGYVQMVKATHAIASAVAGRQKRSACKRRSTPSSRRGLR